MGKEGLLIPENALNYTTDLILAPENLDEYGHLNNAQAFVVLDKERVRIFSEILGVNNLTEMGEKYNLGIVIAAVNDARYLREVRPENNPQILTKLWRPRAPEFMFHQTITAEGKPAVVATFQSFLIDPTTKKLKVRPQEGIFPI